MNEMKTNADVPKLADDPAITTTVGGDKPVVGDPEAGGCLGTGDGPAVHPFHVASRTVRHGGALG